MIVVLDASGAVEIALQNKRASKFTRLLKAADVIVAPDIFVSEVTNVFWKYSQFKQFDTEACLKGIEFCINLIDTFIDSTELWRESYHEGLKNSCSTYDMFYLVATRRNGACLVSMDAQLNKIAGKENLLAKE